MPERPVATVVMLLVLVSTGAMATPQRPSQSPSPGALGQSDLATLQTQIEGALDAVRRGHYLRALSTFDQLIPRVDNELKSILMYNRATCLFKLKRFDEAIIAFGDVANRGGQFEVLGSLNAGFAAVEAENVSTAVQWLSRARAARHTLPERYAILANAVHRLADARRATLIDTAAQAESKGQFELAQRSYQQALNIQHARTAKQTSWLESRLKSLAERDEITANNKRSRQPVSLWVSSAAGYDSNVGRGSAHAGDISFLGVGEGAPIWVQSIEIDGRLVSRKRLRLSVGYMYDLYAVLDSELETLSDHYHEFESALGLQLTPKIDFRARVYGGVSAMALEAPEMYQWHLSAQLRFRLWHSRRNMTEFDVIGGRFAGLNDNDYLTGLHGRIDVGHRWMMGDYRLHAEARLRYRGAGDTAFELLATDLVACDARCDGGSYTVTYAYMSPDLGLSLQYAGWGAVRPQAAVRLGYRYFLDAHYASDQFGSMIEESEKNRADWLVSQSAGLRWQFSKRWSSILRYTNTLNHSNVESGSAGTDHGWDYANRTYTQHAVELELTWSLD